MYTVVSLIFQSINFHGLTDSESVSDCCLMPMQQFFNYITARISYFQWDDGEVHFVLDQRAELDFFIVLAHWNSDTLFWFRANQSLLLLLNAASLAEKQQIPIF